MECGGRRQLSYPDQSERHVPNSMDQLAFKYMEMCKVESSTDSESEISPRWSDTSTMECANSAPERRTFRRTLPSTHKPAMKHGCYSLFLDPYDGSSEDSDESTTDGCVSGRRVRQQGRGGGGGIRCIGKSRRYILNDPAWVCGLDMNRDECRDLKDQVVRDSNLYNEAMDIELCCQFDNPGLHNTRSCTPYIPGPVTPVEVSSPHIPESSLERPPSCCNLRSLYKRKLGFPGAEVVELEQRKRQCVCNMEDSVSEAC